MGGREGSKTPALTSGVGLASGAWCSENEGARRVVGTGNGELRRQSQRL